MEEISIYAAVKSSWKMQKLN